MSLVGLAKVCAHIQNATRVNLALTSIPMTKLHLQVCLELYKEGFLSQVLRGDLNGPDTSFTPTTYDNVSTRRLWLGLKYYRFESVIKSIKLVSKPSRRVIAQPQDLAHLAAGRQFRLVSPPQLGEVLFIRLQDKSVVSLPEAVRNRAGGEILCRVN